MKKRFFLVIALALGLVLASVGTAHAIINGEPDGDEHPYVGVAFFFVDSYPDPDELLGFCSGSLISPTLFLTAGHCTAVGDYAVVVFDSEVPSPIIPWAIGTPYTHPNFCIGCEPGVPGFDTHDVGILVLDPLVELPDEYAALPMEGLADTLAPNTDIDLVGYGAQGLVKGYGLTPEHWPLVVDGKRYFAPTKLVKNKHEWSDEFIKVMANRGRRMGSVCFGDSGGPSLLGGTDTILAINSYGNNYNCSGVSYSQRIDTQDILDWINGFMP